MCVCDTFSAKSKNFRIISSPRSWRLYPTFPSRSFIVLHFAFKSMIRFKLTFYNFLKDSFKKRNVSLSLSWALPICCDHLTSSKQHNQNVSWRLLTEEWACKFPFLYLLWFLYLTGRLKNMIPKPNPSKLISLWNVF